MTRNVWPCRCFGSPGVCAEVAASTEPPLGAECLRRQLARPGPKRLVIGASNHFGAGWIPTEQQVLDLLAPAEYFDERHRFCYQEWSPADGMIRRSRRFDRRNQNGQVRFTSIVADARKPAT